MSFFDDDEGGAPRPAAASTETRVHAPRERRPPRAGYEHDRHTMMVRRRFAAGFGVVLLIVIALVINGCLKSGKEAALKEYNRSAGQLVQESDRQVARPLFETLAGASGKSPLDVEEEVNQLRLLAQTQASHAHGMSAPGEMQGAQRNLLLAFNLRSEGLAKIANLVRTALGGQDKQASSYIAGAMELFLTSDVIWSQRVAPLTEEALKSAGIAGEHTQGTQFLPNLGWLEPSTVQARLSGQPATGNQGSQVTPGTHGSSLVGVSVGSTALEPSPALNHVSGGTNPTFTVKVEDSGSNPETGVKVEVSVTAGGKEYKASHVINKTEPGATATVDIPVEGVPQGAAARIAVNVAAVPGETNSENNKGTYLAVFGA
ncbi:MAG TPA: hypothetical protein VGI76_02350 [Solirubrobacteraceae bacterium]